MTRPQWSVVLILLGWMAGGGGACGQTVERDLAYGPDPLQRLDLSVPAAKGFPTVLFVHGGSLTLGVTNAMTTMVR